MVIYVPHTYICITKQLVMNLNQKIEKFLKTKKGEFRKDANYVVDILNGINKVYPCRYSGSGRYTACSGGSHHTTSYLNILGIEYVEGNDAARGGWSGNSIELTPKGIRQLAKYRANVRRILAAEREVLNRRIAESKAKTQAELDALGDQHENLNIYFKEHPGKAQIWDSKTESMGSSKWRSWLRMKAASKVANNRFDLLTLSAPEILGIVKSNL